MNMELENNNLLLITDDEVITISNSFSKLPTDKYGNAIYYIDEDGLEKIRDINLQDTEKIVEKW